MPDSDETATTPVVPDPELRGPEAPDAELLNAVDLARAALLEITGEETIGKPAGHLVEGENALSLLFEASMTGYPGWFWTVSVGRVDGEAATVLEAELMPGESALLAPEWVPWSERLAELSVDEPDDDDEDESDEESDDDDDDADDHGSDDDDDDDDDDDAYDDDVDIDVFGDESPIDDAPADSDPSAHDLNDDDADDAEGEADDAGQQPSAAGVDVIAPDQHGDESE